MSDQALDRRKSTQVIRRHRFLVGIVAALGLLAGAAAAFVTRPMLTSTALVVLPGLPGASQSAPATDTPGGDIATQVVIARSDPVLTRALPHISSPMSVETLRNEVVVSSQTSNILAISATSRTAAAAETTANAVAKSYIRYITSPSSPTGQVSANMLQPAVTATGTSRAKQVAVYALIGAMLGALIGIITASIRSRSDRRLKGLDEIANSIGIPVLASFPVAHPTTPAGWTKLLEEYKPRAVHALRLRQALEQLAVGTGSYDGNSSLAVLSLSSDPRAVAIGPQLAIFAASLGIPTALVVDPQGDATATAGLRVACSLPPPASSNRPSQLRVLDKIDAERQPDAVLSVAVVVIDDQNPRVADTLRTTATVLGVSAGAATAEQLAKAAASAAADGREIVGILVADPEPTDRTTGRIQQPIRPIQRSVLRTP
jgi:capsular polysaccharide biosynthesis protein